MKKVIVLGVIGSSLFAGPLFNAFKVGVDAAQERFLLLAKIDGYLVLEGVNYFGRAEKENDWTDMSIDWWNGKGKEIDGKLYNGNERLALWAGKTCYACAMKQWIEETYELNLKLGNVGPSFDEQAFTATWTVKDFYARLKGDWKGWCKKLWTWKKYGPNGKISWKRWVLTTIKQGSKKKE